MSHWGEFDNVIINDDMAAAVSELEAILRGEGANSRVGSQELHGQIEKILV